MDNTFKKSDFIDMLKKYSDFQGIQNDLAKVFWWGTQNGMLIAEREINEHSTKMV